MSGEDNGYTRLVKAILEDSFAVAISDEQVRAGHAYIEQTMQLAELEIEDIDESYIRALYTVMRGLEGMSPEDARKAGKAMAARRPRADTAAELQRRELSITEVDYKLVAQQVRQQVRDLNAYIEMIVEMGVAVELSSDVASSGETYHSLHGMMFRGYGGRAHRPAKATLPKLAIKLSKTEKL